MSDIVQMGRGDFEFMQTLMMSGIVGVVIMLGFVIWMFRVTPAFEYVKCRFLKRKLINVLTNDGRLLPKAVSFKDHFGNIKNIGKFKFNPTARLSMSGVIGGIAFEDNSEVLPVGFIHSAYNLVKGGIENIEAAEGQISDVRLKAMLMDLRRCCKDMSNEEFVESLKKEKFSAAAIALAKDPNRLFQDKEGNDLHPAAAIALAKDPSLVDANDADIYSHLIDFELVKRFMMYDMSPGNTNEVIERTKADMRMTLGKGFAITPDHVIAFIMVVMACAIAWHIIQSGGVATGGEVVSVAKDVVVAPIPVP